MAMIPMEYSGGGGTWQTITRSGAPTNTTVKCKKDNSTIALHIDGQNMTSNQWVHLGTLPADMLPESNLYAAGTSSGTSGISVGYVYVEAATGKVNGWTTQVQCHCDFAFMIKD